MLPGTYRGYLLKPGKPLPLRPKGEWTCAELGDQFGPLVLVRNLAEQFKPATDPTQHDLKAWLAKGKCPIAIGIPHGVADNGTAVYLATFAPVEYDDQPAPALLN